MAAANASLGDLRTWTHHVVMLQMIVWDLFSSNPGQFRNWSDRRFPLFLPKCLLAKIRRRDLLLNRPLTLAYSPTRPSMTVFSYPSLHNICSWNSMVKTAGGFLDTFCTSTLNYGILVHISQVECFSRLDVALLANKYQFLKNAIQLIVYVSRLLVQWFALNFCICGSW